MAHELVREVFDFAPPGVAGHDLVVLLAIAEGAQTFDRPEWPARTWGGDLAAAARINPSSLGRVLQRLRDRHLEVRVPIGADASGRVVFARRGVASTYRLPDLAALAASEGRTSVRPAIDRKHDGQTDVRPTEAVRPDARPAMTAVSPDPRPAVEAVRPDARPRLAGRTSGPNQKNQKNHHHPARTDVDDQLAAVRHAAAMALVVVIRETFPKPTAAGSARALERRAVALREAGFTPATLTTALADVDVSSARTPAAALLTRLDGLAVTGPARRTRAAATSTTCPVHGTTTSGACSSCSADHKAGQHRDDEDGPSTACHLCTSSRRSAA